MYFATTRIVEDLLSLTASEEVSTFEVTNLQDPLGSARWRSTSLTPHIYGQFAQSETVDFWGAWYCNARSGDQARLRLATSQANLTASPVKDTGLVDVWPAGSDLSGWFVTRHPGYVHQRATISSPAAATWFRIDFDFTGNTDGYVEVGALPIDQRFTPGDAPAHEWRFLPASRGAYSVAYAAGGEGRGGGTHKRDAKFQFLNLSKTEMWGSFSPMVRERLMTRPVCVILDEAESTYPMDYLYYGYLEVQEIVNPFNRFTSEVVIREP